MCTVDDECFDSPCYVQRHDLFQETARFLFAVDHCMNQNDTVMFMTQTMLTIGSDPPVSKPSSEWVREAHVLMRIASPDCINQTSCSDFIADKELLLRAQEILSELLDAIEAFDMTLECHPDTIGIMNMECYPRNGYWGAAYWFEDQLKFDEFIDSDMNDLVAVLYVCIARDYDLTTHALWIETLPKAKGSYYQDQALKMTLNGSFVEQYPGITYVDPTPLMPTGIDYAVTRRYSFDQTPLMGTWNETSMIITLINDTSHIFEPLNITNLPKTQRIIDTDTNREVVCPREFMHTIVYPNSSAPQPITPILSVPPIYVNAVRRVVHRSSCMALEEGIGNSSTVFNSNDFAVSVLNIATGVHLPHTCFPWPGERTSIFNAYPSFGPYSTWLLSNGTTPCAEDSSCYYWYNNPNPALVYNLFDLVGAYGFCFI